MVSRSGLQQNLQLIQEQIQIAADRTSRSSEEIILVAVSKAFLPDIWDTALKDNLKTLGESRIQEAEDKVKSFQHRDKIELHLIGHLQGNKAKKAVELFDVIQTVDSIKLAKRLDNYSADIGKKQRIFLQVNTGADPKKQGFSSEETILASSEISKLPNIILEGIMTIPPHGLPEGKLRSVYSQTRQIRDKIRSEISNNCQRLSMGMSEDFEIAIEEGATHIRVGTALFGERPQ